MTFSGDDKTFRPLLLLLSQAQPTHPASFRGESYMPWECETTIRWVSELGAPLQPNIYRFKGAVVPISDGHIRQGGVGFCPRLTWRVAFRSYGALAPMAVTGVLLTVGPSHHGVERMLCGIL